MIHLCPFCRQDLKVLQSVVIVSSPTKVINAFGSRILFDEQQAEFGQQVIHEDCMKQQCEMYEQIFKDENSKIIERGKPLSESSNSTIAELANQLCEVLQSVDLKVSKEECASFIIRTKIAAEDPSDREEVMSSLVKAWFSKRKT